MWFPVPFHTGASVVELVGPRFGNRLTQRIDLEFHFKFRNVFLDFCIDDIWVETHGSDVERVAVTQTRRIGFHNLDSRTQGIGHIHHVHEGAWGNRTNKLLAFHCRIVDIHSVVGGATAWRGNVGNQTRESHRAGVHAKLERIIIAEQFARHLGHAIHGAWLLNGVLWSAVFWRVGAERANRAWGEHGAFLFARHFKHVHQTINADVPCQLGLVFSHSAEQGCEVVNRVDVVFVHHFGDLLRIGDVHYF